ncbi:MAG: class A beta-lactamase-related serine hydrolase [Candidatus Saganbacteria bacterium]|nr:class A beta-lactamase-related serine hydrolase [Candidatus Saganbacteria bacterium]
MRKKIIFTTILIIGLWASQAFAQFDTSEQNSLTERINDLLEPYGRKVGFTFIDLKSGWELSYNGSLEFPAASVAKVPVMAATYHLAEIGQVNLSQRVLVTNQDKLGGSGILQWLRGSRYYSLKNLVQLMITQSDNTATRLVVNHLSMEAINAYLKKIGLTKTKINDPTMLVEPPRTKNNRTTPQEMAKLVIKIQSSDGFLPSSSKEMLYFMKTQRYHWGIWGGLPPGIYVANKTGNLDGILNDVGIVYTNSGNYAISVFTWGFKKQRDARKIVNELSKACFEEYTGIKVPVKAKKKVIAKKKQKKKSYYKKSRLRRKH